jgi:hypothetical protein
MRSDNPALPANPANRRVVTAPRCEAGTLAAETAGTGAPDDIEITEDMTYAAADLLLVWQQDISRSMAEKCAEEMLRRAFAVRTLGGGSSHET